MKARLLTGRTHQIRAHLPETGLHILADSLYGPGRSASFAATGRRVYPVALRAVQLKFPNRSGHRRWTVAPTEAFLGVFHFPPPAKPETAP